MKNFKKWLDQALIDYKAKHNNINKKENVTKKNKKPLPEGVLLTTYIVVIDTVVVMGLITIFIIKIL